MPSFHHRLFGRIVTTRFDIYLLKTITLSIAFASTICITLFSFNQFGYDSFHEQGDRVFRILQRNNGEDYNGNRLSVSIPANIIQRFNGINKDSLSVSRVKIMDHVSVGVAGQNFQHQRVHSVDPSIVEIFSFTFIDSTNIDLTGKAVVLLSSDAALTYFGELNVAGKQICLSTHRDTIDATVGAVFKGFPKNSHEKFTILLTFRHSDIAKLNFDPDKTGMYVRALKGSAGDFEEHVNGLTNSATLTYSLQPLTEIFFGPRVLGEGASHGDSYSIIILLCITGLILFLAFTTFLNLTTFTLPDRSKEIAVKKLAGISQVNLYMGFFKESLALVTIAMIFSILILAAFDVLLEPIVGFQILPEIANTNTILLYTIGTLYTLFVGAPVLMARRFVRSTPNRLLKTDTITFPGFKRIITCLQIGVSIFLIVTSVVVRRQINYSLLKEPGRNHDQIVYLNCPSGLTAGGIHSLREGWKKFNPNVLDAMGVSQLPDRVKSKELASPFYLLHVDPGFIDFFNMKVSEGRWFKVNDEDSLFVINKRARELARNNDTSVIGVLPDFNGQFNKPDLPLKIKLAKDYGYNWLCVRVLEVDIRRTVNKLAADFSMGEKKSQVHYFDKHFAAWMTYQDGLNSLSSVLGAISAVLSCLAVYALSISLVRDKMKQIAIHKLHGAHVLHITRILARDFVTQMLIAIIIFGPLTYIFLNELLRVFVHSTKLHWLDPVYPTAYCAFVIVVVSMFHALSLNRTNLTSVLKQ